MTYKEKWEAISVLSEMRSEYNCFNEKERPYYHALSLAIKSLRNEQIEIKESEEEVWQI